MGVYIDMEMPENEPLIVKINPDGSVSTTAKNGYKKYKAVPVPPHEDLIDRDANLMSLRKVLCDPFSGRGTIETAMIRACIKVFEEAPTIIPAEEGET